MAKLLATDSEGERLDRFELVAELASGGMATVYLARLSGVAGFQRLVAIKRLHPHLAKEPDFIEMFLDEARLAARIHHPNVVPIQEVGESSSGYYLVMDYVEGDTLARLLARAAQTKTRIPWGVTIRILLDTLAGLHAAHELTDDLGAPLAIVHRDVSPQNILVGSDGIARITDFGVARAASRLSTTRSGQLKGKLAYMAPEQARGGEIDRRADLFSCGIVLWEALALKRLFKGDGEAATLNRVLYDPIAPPSSQRSDVPAALEAVCMRALERDVDKRFATAEDFADELERVARSLSCVGSVRDVAACLEEVFGSDLTQQRDAVRAWLARSEPSAAPRSRRSLPESAPTRVERGKSEPSSPRSGPGSAPSGPGSAPSGPGSAPSGPGSAPSGAARPAFVDRLAVTAPAPADPASFGVPDKVSSVSSAVLHVSAADATGAVPAPSRRSAGRLVALAAALVVVVGAAAWGASRLREPAATAPAAAGDGRAGAVAGDGAGERGATAAGASNAGAAGVPSGEIANAPGAGASNAAAGGDVSGSGATAPGASSASSATAAGASSATAAGASSAARPVRRPARPARSTTAPTAPPGPTSVPDDLSKNPYR